jgi:GT2 family glycosyltransferase
MTLHPPDGFRLADVTSMPRALTEPIRITHPDPSLAVSLTPAAPLRSGWYRLRLAFGSQGLVRPLAQFTYAGGTVEFSPLPATDRNIFESNFRIGFGLERITIHLQGSGHLDQWLVAEFSPIGTMFGTMSWLRTLFRRAIDLFAREGTAAFIRKLTANAVRFAIHLNSPGTLVVAPASLSKRGEDAYQTWIRVFDERPEVDRARHDERLTQLERRPVVSIFVFGVSDGGEHLTELPASVRKQIYPEWELLRAVSVTGKTRSAMEPNEDGASSASIKAIAVMSGDGLPHWNLVAKAAHGEYVLICPPGTELRPHALLDLALALTRYPSADLIYWDEDHIGAGGVRHGPLFKPAWAPDYFLSYDYLGPVLVRRAWLAGCDSDAMSFEALKLELTSAGSPVIVHLAKVLSHRVADTVTCPQDMAPRFDDVAATVSRLFPGCRVEPAGSPALPRIHYPVSDPPVLVSLIIPTRDRAALLEKCIGSIRSRTDYAPIEIIVVDNGSSELATQRLFAQLANDDAIRILSCPGPFNYSRLNNLAADQARGVVLGLINNDIEVIDPGWLTEMLSLAMRPNVGCVGAKLLYPNDSIQHAGIYLGVGGPTRHGFRLADRSAASYMERMRTVQNISAVTGACLLVRKKVFDEVGGLDEKHLAVSFNDVDLCLKVRNAGYHNLWTPFAELYHHESMSRGLDYSRSKANRLTGEVDTIRHRWTMDLIDDPYYSPNLSLDDDDFSVRRR